MDLHDMIRSYTVHDYMYIKYTLSCTTRLSMSITDVVWELWESRGYDSMAKVSDTLRICIWIIWIIWMWFFDFFETNLAKNDVLPEALPPFRHVSFADLESSWRKVRACQGAGNWKTNGKWKWKMHKNMEKNTRRKKCIQMLQMQVCWGIRDLECLQLVLSRPPSLSPAEFLDSPKVVRCSFPSEPFCFAVSHRFTTFPSPGSIELIWRLNLKLQLHPMASFWANAQGSNESRIMFRYFDYFTCLYIIVYVDRSAERFLQTLMSFSLKSPLCKRGVFGPQRQFVKGFKILKR